MRKSLLMKRALAQPTLHQRHRPVRCAPCCHARLARRVALGDRDPRWRHAPLRQETAQRKLGQGLLRHIDSAFAAQVLRLDAKAPAPLLVAAAMLAHMEGRGHTCLPLAELCQPPVALLGWPAAAVDGAQGLKALWAHLHAET